MKTLPKYRVIDGQVTIQEGGNENRHRRLERNQLEQSPAGGSQSAKTNLQGCEVR
jgi:hypothetical protein